MSRVRATEWLPGVFFVCSFPRDQFPEGPQPVVQAEKPGTFWLLVGSRHGPLPLQFEQVPPQLAGSMNTVPVPQVHRQPCWYPTTDGPASSDSPGAMAAESYLQHGVTTHRVCMPSVTM